MRHSINLGKNKCIKNTPTTYVDDNGYTILTFESSDMYTKCEDSKIKKGDIVKINKVGDRYRYSSLNDAFGVTKHDIKSEVTEGCCAYVQDVIYNNMNGVVTAIIKSKGHTYIYSVENLSVVLRLGDSFLNYNRTYKQFCVERYTSITECGNILSIAKNPNSLWKGTLVCMYAVPLSDFDFKKTDEENLKKAIKWC